MRHDKGKALLEACANYHTIFPHVLINAELTAHPKLQPAILARIREMPQESDEPITSVSVESDARDRDGRPLSMTLYFFTGEHLVGKKTYDLRHLSDGSMSSVLQPLEAIAEAA